MAQELVEGVRFVVHTKTINHGGTGLVQADQIHLRAGAAELEHHLVQRTHGGYVPEVMGLREC